MKKSIYAFVLSMLGLVFSNHLQAQECLERPEPIIFSADTSICPGNLVTFHAAINPDYPTSTTPINTQALTDDTYSGLIPLGFSFEFYGNTYTHCIISSNNYISFATGNAGGYSSWSIDGAAPSATTPQLSVMCPWQDVNPGAGGQVRYQTLGTAPNRIFVVEFCNIPMFSCTGQLFTDQILLYEGCNIIETNIVSKTLCTSWNDGKAIHGLSKNSTTAHIVPGRNAPGHWTAAMDGYRFTPDPTDVNNYFIEPVPYNPVLMGLSNDNIKWYKGTSSTTPLATGTTMTDAPTEATTYVVEIAAGGSCNGVIQRYNIVADFNSNYYDTVTAQICGGEIYNHYGDVYYESGVYTKHLSYINSCDTFRTVILTVNPAPDPTVSATQTSICEGQNAIISATNAANGTTFSWLKDEVVIPGANSSSYSATSPGAYRVVLTTDKGCVDTSRQVTIHVNPPVDVQIASRDMDFSTLCIGDTVLLSVVNPESLVEYRWSPMQYFRFLDGYRQSTVRAVVTEPTYLLVEAMNQYGCTDADSIFVNPKPCCDTHLPTAFSPNADGLNDHFNILLQPGQKVVTFQVFDRLGNMVYDNHSPLKGWNGRINNSGDLAHQGVYYYRIVYSCTDKQNYEVKGDITLVK